MPETTVLHRPSFEDICHETRTQNLVADFSLARTIELAYNVQNVLNVKSYV